MKRQENSVYSALGVLGLLGLILVSSTAFADADVRPNHLVAVGARLGVLPPIFTVGELLLRPSPNFALGAFGLPLPGSLTVGAEALVELADPGNSGAYLQIAYAYYVVSGPNWERSTAAYVTAGYILMLGSTFDLQFGTGAVYLLSDEKAPCTGFYCSGGGFTPSLMPTIDLGVHFRVL